MQVEHENASTTNDNDNVQENLSLLKTTQDAYDKIADKPEDWSHRKGNTFKRNQNSKLETIFKSLTKTNTDKTPDLFVWQCACTIYAISLKIQTNNATKKRWKPKTKMTEDIRWKDHEYYKTSIPNYGGSKKNGQQQKHNKKSMRKKQKMDKQRNWR